MPTHAFIALLIAFAAGVYVGNRFASRTIDKVKTEIGLIEREVQYYEKEVADMVLSVITSIKRHL